MSAVIIKHYYTDNNLDKVHTHFYNYGEDISDEIYKDCDNAKTIILTDITLPDEFMEKYAEKIIWIDHHDSQINSKKEWKSRLKENLSCIQNDQVLDYSGHIAKKVSATELTFLKYRPYNANKNPLIEYFVRLIGRRDVWDKDPYLECEYLNAYLKYLYLNPPDTLINTSALSNLFNNLFIVYSIIVEQSPYKGMECMYEILDRGKKLYHIQQKKNKETYLRNAFKIKLFNFTFIGINEKGDSSILESNNTDPDVDGYVMFKMHKNGYWMVSLYKGPSKTDVSMLSIIDRILDNPNHEVFNHGGHKNACGFETCNLNVDFLQYCLFLDDY